MKVWHSVQSTSSDHLLEHWQCFWSMFNLWYRVDDLERLIVWARRKRLPGPYGYYTRLLEDANHRLTTYCFRFPALARWARLLYQVNLLVSPPARCYAKGSATEADGCTERGAIGALLRREGLHSLNPRIR